MSIVVDWGKALQALRAQFLEGAAVRLERMETRVARLESDACDGEALGDLRLAFHAFSGIGGSHGLPRVTQLGLSGEQRCDELLSVGCSPSDSDLAACRGLLEELHTELGAAVASAEPAA